jgi:hypothetical protein
MTKSPVILMGLFLLQLTMNCYQCTINYTNTGSRWRAFVKLGKIGILALSAYNKVLTPAPLQPGEGKYKEPEAREFSPFHF